MQKRQVRIAIKHPKKSAPVKEISWLKRLWTTIVATGFMVFTFFFFSFFIAFFITVFMTALIFGIWLQSRLQKKKSGEVIETDYTVIKDEGQDNDSHKKENSKAGHSPPGPRHAIDRGVRLEP